MDHSCSGERNTAVAAWAIASNGDVLIRHGVCSLNPRGDAWEHITSDQPLVGISVGPTGQVWTVARNGMVFFRYGISRQNPCGDAWQQVEAPAGVTFKAISVGRAGIWALDNQQRLAVRKEISRTFLRAPTGSFCPMPPMCHRTRISIVASARCPWAPRCGPSPSMVSFAGAAELQRKILQA